MPRKIPALVGIVPRKKLWTLIQKENWYHIPVKAHTVPDNILSVKYVAFYFPKCFAEGQQYKVIYYAKVIKIDTVKRIELFPNEPRHERANEDYYRIQLQDIKKLPYPILNWKSNRIIHIPTNKQKLFSAKRVSDLWDGSPLEEKMYKALEKTNIIAVRQYYIDTGDNKYLLDFAIFCHKGDINVECDGKEFHTNFEARISDRQRNNQLTAIGWHILRFSGQEINHDIKDCLITVDKTIKRLGGLKKRI